MIVPFGNPNRAEIRPEASLSVSGALRTVPMRRYSPSQSATARPGDPVTINHVRSDTPLPLWNIPPSVYVFVAPSRNAPELLRTEPCPLLSAYSAFASDAVM